MNTFEYVESYLKTLPPEHGFDGRFFVIGLIGLPGSGKSTFSRALSSKTGLYIASNDEIRHWLSERGIEDIDAHQGLVEQIAEARTLFLLNRHISHIIDADMIKHQGLFRRYAEDYGAKCYIFHLPTPEDVIIQRLLLREREGFDAQSGQISRAGMEIYQTRKAIHQMVGYPEQVDLVIDSTVDADSEVGRVVEFLAKQATTNN